MYKMIFHCKNDTKAQEKIMSNESNWFYLVKISKTLCSDVSTVSTSWIKCGLRVLTVSRVSLSSPVGFLWMLARELSRQSSVWEKSTQKWLFTISHTERKMYNWLIYSLEHVENRSCYRCKCIFGCPAVPTCSLATSGATSYTSVSSIRRELLTSWRTAGALCIVLYFKRHFS